MPFFDTYFGPLKGEHQYWVGVLLLARGILLTVFAITPSNATKVDLLSISIVSAVLLVYLVILPHMKQQKSVANTLGELLSNIFLASAETW